MLLLWANKSKIPGSNLGIVTNGHYNLEMRIDHSYEFYLPIVTMHSSMHFRTIVLITIPIAWDMKAPYPWSIHHPKFIKLRFCSGSNEMKLSRRMKNRKCFTIFTYFVRFNNLFSPTIRNTRSTKWHYRIFQWSYSIINQTFIFIWYDEQTFFFPLSSLMLRMTVHARLKSCLKNSFRMSIYSRV